MLLNELDEPKVIYEVRDGLGAELKGVYPLNESLHAYLFSIIVLRFAI